MQGLYDFFVRQRLARPATQGLAVVDSGGNPHWASAAGGAQVPGAGALATLTCEVTTDPDAVVIQQLKLDPSITGVTIGSFTATKVALGHYRIAWGPSVFPANASPGFRQGHHATMISHVAEGSIKTVSGDHQVDIWVDDSSSPPNQTDSNFLVSLYGN